MKTIYGTYRMAYTNTGNRYSISYFINNELSDYVAAGLVSIDDMSIGDHQYTQELAPGLKSKTRFFKASYNEQYVPAEHFEIVKSKMVANHYAVFFDTPEEAAQWVRDNTSLKEKEAGVFVTIEANKDEGIDEATLEIS